MRPSRRSAAGLLLAGLAGFAAGQEKADGQPAQPAATTPAKPAKGIGEPAPRLTDVEWLLGKPLKQFARGTAYVVYFWAPWNDESLRALPVLAALQERVASQRVAVVAVVLQDRPDIVPAGGWGQRHKADLPVVVATDVLDKTKATWDALIGTRVPLAVIVDRAGRVAWRGHPLNGLDEALGAVLADDKAALDKVVAERRALSDKLNPLAADLQKYAGTDGMERRCCELVDEILALNARLAAPWLDIKYHALRRLGKKEEAAAWGRLLVGELLRDDMNRLNGLAWSIVDPQAKDKDGDFELARLAAERSNELARGQDAAILDTLARVRWRDGQHAEAVALQKKAVELAWTADLRKQLQKTLGEYQAPKGHGGG